MKNLNLIFMISCFFFTNFMISINPEFETQMDTREIIKEKLTSKLNSLFNVDQTVITNIGNYKMSLFAKNCILDENNYKNEIFDFLKAKKFLNQNDAFDQELNEAKKDIKDDLAACLAEKHPYTWKNIQQSIPFITLSSFCGGFLGISCIKRTPAWIYKTMPRKALFLFTEISFFYC